MKKGLTKAYAIGWTALFHTLATLVVAVIVSLPSIDWVQVQMIWASYSMAGFEPDWVKIALHLGLAACLWSLIVIVYLLVQTRRSEKRDVTRLVKQSRGTVLTETLIVLVPFLLLTSGLAQLAMLNVTALLVDLAAFQAARVVFVWAPEVNQPRYESNYGGIQIRDRARTIASMALAPTAANDYYLGRIPEEGSSNYFRRQRAIMTGAFMPDSSQPPWNFEWSGGQTALTGGGAFDGDADSPIGDNVSYVSGFDTQTFRFRAARKMTQAEWGLYKDFQTICPTTCDQVNANESGVHFTYWYNIVFPWFGYIWGEWENIGQRTGWYAKIERRHTFPAQPMP